MLVRTILLLLTAAISASAQNITGTILGTVTDPSGATIAGADVEITQVETNQSTRVKTDGNGFFQAPYLRPATIA